MDTYIEIGGKRYRLKYSVNAMCAVEEISGGSLDKLMDMQFSACRLLLWGALIAYQPEITLTMAGELIGKYLQEGGTLEKVVDTCANALSEAGFFPPAEL